MIIYFSQFLFSLERELFTRLNFLADTATESGRYLIKEFISQWKDSEIHLFCYDCDINRTSEELGIYQKYVTLYDCLPELASDLGLYPANYFASRVHIVSRLT